MPDALLEIRGLVKDYQSLRPLRVRELVVTPGDVLSIGGLDAAAAEMLVHLVTGAALPDEGEIRLFGRSTRDAPDAQSWLQSLDGLGLVNARGVHLDMFTPIQNIGLSLTLDVDPLDADVRAAAERLAAEVGIPGERWPRPLGGDAETTIRVGLARALAANPRLVVAEHPSATLPRAAVAGFGARLAAAARARGTALVVLTADPALRDVVGGRRLELKPATGEVLAAGGFVERLKRTFGG